jgi:hypothetical protein
MGVLIWLTQPCIVMTMLLPCLGGAAMIARR